MLGDVISAQGERVIVVFPVALDQFDIEPFVLEAAILDRAEDRCFTGEADVADADLVGFRFGKCCFFLAADEEQRGQRRGLLLF